MAAALQRVRSFFRDTPASNAGASGEWTLEDHMRGCLYGNAVGDAIGLLTEFMIRSEVKQYYGNCKALEYNMKVPDFHRNRWEEGDWTDDTDQMILIMDMLLEKNGKVDPRDFAARMRRWRIQGFRELGDFAGLGVGQTTAKVIEGPGFLKDPHHAAFFVWDANQRRMAPNGGVMRTSILGVHQYDDLDAVVANTLAICKVTHADPRCQASCVAVTTAIAMMLQRKERHVLRRGGYNVDAIMADALNYARQCLSTDKEVEEMKRHMYSRTLAHLKLTEVGKIGYTYKCMGSGFWALRQNDFRKTLQAITAEGGDADTNGAVAGALLGCKLGIHGLPDSWLSGLKHKDWFEERLCRFIRLVTEGPSADDTREEKAEKEEQMETSKNEEDTNEPSSAKAAQSEEETDKDKEKDTPAEGGNSAQEAVTEDAKKET